MTDLEAFIVATPDDIPLGIHPSGTITLDATSAPHVTADITVTLDSDTLELLDPRDSPRVRIVADSRVFDLGVRSRPVSQSDATVRVSLASDEALLGDYAPLADDATPLTHVASLRDVVDYVLDEALGAALEATPAIDYDFTGTGYNNDAFTWKAGQSGLAFLQPLVQAAGFRLVCDETRAWTLRDEEYVLTPTIAIRYGVNMNAGSDVIDRDAGLWCDACVVRYRWTTAAGEALEEIDAFALSTPYTLLRLIERDTPYPGAGFAAYVVRRAQFRGREVEATRGADWTARAEQYVSIVLDGAPTQTGVVESIEYDIAGDRMTVRSRTVDTPPLAWVLGPDTLTWDDVEPTLTWDDITAWTDLEVP